MSHRNMLEHIQELRNGGSVRRWHTKRTIRDQTVAEHTCGVLMLVTELFPMASAHLYRAVLMHDMAEVFTGDIPAPAKWASPELDLALQKLETDFHQRTKTQVFLDDSEVHILKWCDMMELVLWCREEMMMGNTMMGKTWEAGMNHLLKLGPPNEDARKLYMEISANMVALDLG